jgi:hypothetical protein
MDDSDKSPLVFLAENTADKIQDIKDASFRVLVSCSAIFAYLMANKVSLCEANVYFWLKNGFIVGCTFSIALCGVFYPLKLSRSREKLKEAYRGLGSQFAKAYGNIDKVTRNDAGDWMYPVLSGIYLVFLIFVISS